jgi:hypothetical protein
MSLFIAVGLEAPQAEAVPARERQRLPQLVEAYGAIIFVRTGSAPGVGPEPLQRPIQEIIPWIIRAWACNLIHYTRNC